MKINFLFFLLFSAVIAFGQSVNEKTFQRLVQLPDKATPGQTAVEIGKQFLNKPYVAATLEKSPEGLVCNLNEFDCYTFVENVVAITRVKELGYDDYQDYQNMLRLLRYRDGKINGYASRIHYFTEWVQQAENGGVVTDLTKSWGTASGKSINFMSTHAALYPAMKDAAVREKIGQMEKMINETPFFEVKKADFPKIEKYIKDGDIVVFTSTVGGLDVNHEGFAVWQNGKLHLMHASLDYKKVIISPQTINEYLNSIKKHQGVMVLRLN